MTKEEYDLLSGRIISACNEVHKNLGPGLLEKVYEFCLMKELQMRGINAECQVPVPLVYKGFETEKTYLIDILVEDSIPIEIKAAEVMNPVYEAQIISYLKLANKKLGLLVNFNVPLMKNGIKRFVNRM